MTREQEIKKQAEKKALEPSRLMHPYAKQHKVMSAYEIGFIEGAVWADETMLNKACKWLDCYIDNYLFIDAENKAGIRWDDFINDFRKAMKGEYKFNEDEIEPIPLTPEILEKNGFKECTNGDWTNDNVDFILYRRKDGIFRIQNTNMTLPYVSSFQHALRLCTQKQILATMRRLEERGCAMNKELCKYYRSWVGTSKDEIICACVDYERKIITKCDFVQNKGCWKTQRKEAHNDKTTH